MDSEDLKCGVCSGEKIACKSMKTQHNLYNILYIVILYKYPCDKGLVGLIRVYYRLISYP